MKGTLGYFKRLATKANQTTNSEEAKNIRKQLLKWGAILTGIGIVLLIIAMVVFMSGAFSGHPTDIGSAEQTMNKMITFSIIGMVLFIISGVLTGIGGFALKLGFGIVIAGVTTKVIDANDEENKSVNTENDKYKYCPHCKAQINKNAKFCPNCGKTTSTVTICKHCGTINPTENNYCENCATKLK